MGHEPHPSPPLGPAPSFEAVYAAHAAILIRRIARILPHHEAEEVVHETLLSYWLQPARYDPRRGSLRTFLGVRARGKALDRLRSSRASSRRDTGWADDVAAGWTDQELDARREVVDALRKLSAPQREAIVLAYLEDLTYAETAARLGLAEGTAKSRIRSGLRNLAQLLEGRSTDEQRPS